MVDFALSYDLIGILQTKPVQTYDGWSDISYDYVSNVMKTGAVDINATDKSGASIIHAAATRLPYLPPETAYGYVSHEQKRATMAYQDAGKILDLMLAKGKGLINTQDKVGNTALHSVVLQSENPQAIKTLILAGADVSVANTDGKTPLQLAQDKLARLKDGVSGTTLSASKGQQLAKLENSVTMLSDPAAVIALSKDQAKRDAATKIGQEFRDAFSTGDSQKISQLMVDHPAEFEQGKNDGLIMAVKTGKPNVMRFLMKQGADTKTQYSQVTDSILFMPGVTQQGSLLHWAALAPESQSVEIATSLIKDGVDLSTKGTDGANALHWAAKHKNVALIKLLADKKIDINIRDDNEQTPLHYAAASSDGTVAVNALLDRNANVNAMDNRGDTALHVAIKGGNLDAVTALIGKGAKLDIANKESKTPLQLISERFKDAKAKGAIMNAMKKSIDTAAISPAGDATLVAQHGLSGAVQKAADSLGGSITFS